MSEQGNPSRFATVDVICLLAFFIGLIVLLNFYGYALLPSFPDESLFLQPAQNLMEGKGFGTPALDNLLPGISQRTYWQPPVYFLVLAAWGKLFGFDVLSSRLMSRFCAIGVLILLWLLANRWGVSRWLALICVIWTGLDLTFQYNANFGRMDTLNAFWLLASLFSFTTYEEKGKDWQAGLAGGFGALATLTHFIAIPNVLALGAILAWWKRWKALVWFSFPIAVGWVLWLTYAAQDWQSWHGQLWLQFAQKSKNGLFIVLPRALFLQSFLPLFGVFSTNVPPIWFALVALSVWGWMRKHLPIKSWQIVSLSMTYFSAAIGGEPWYIGWWTPFGYLWLCSFLQFGLERLLKGFWLFALRVFCALWICWQLLWIGRTVTYVPILKRDVDKFYSELQTTLPKGSKILLHSIPDAFPYLQRTRPDLKMVQLSPTPMPLKAIAQVSNSSDLFVGVTEWAEKLGLTLADAKRYWFFRTPLGGWSVKIHLLKSLRVKGK